MTAPDPINFGRGAWTTLGHACGGPFYRKAVNKASDGSYLSIQTPAHEAVHLGVVAIQTEINRMDISPAIKVDGLFGVATTIAAKRMQTQMGVTADGIVGPGTCRQLWRRPILHAAVMYGIDPRILYGQVSHESSFDPGAVGYNHPPDRGLIQINTNVHPVTLEWAHDTAFALDWSAKRLQAASQRYSGMLRVDCMILQHNNPSGADYLYKNGSCRSDADEAYIEAVKLAYAAW